MSRSKVGTHVKRVGVAVDRLSELSGWLSAVALGASMLVICSAVTLRSLGYSTIWQTEAAIYLLLFVTFVGAAYGVKHDVHVRVTLVGDRLTEKRRLQVQLVADLVTSVFLLILAWRSVVMWVNAVQLDLHSGSTWNPPLFIPFGILLVGVGLMLLQYGASLARVACRLKDSASTSSDVDAVGAPTHGGPAMSVAGDHQ